MLRLRNLGLIFSAALVTLLVSTRALAVTEVIGYGGLQSFNAISGCCVSVPPKATYGVGLRLEALEGIYQVLGITDLRWSEITLLKTHYLKGRFSQLDPSNDEDISVTRYDRWQIALSYGAGFFVHTTQQTRLNLPVSVNGVLAMTHLEAQYLVSDQFSLVAVARGGAAISLDNLGLVTGALGGLSFRF